MFGRLSGIHNDYSAVVHSHRTQYEKDQALASLMTQMEKEFRIPLLKNEKWESEHKTVIALYRIISESRSAFRITE